MWNIKTREGLGASQEVPLDYKCISVKIDIKTTEQMNTLALKI